MPQHQIHIPERQEDESPATAEQLQFIRQLVSGLSLQGYRFDYRKLGKRQASEIIDQLLELQKQSGEPAPTKPKKQGPGCIASLAKATTALVVWLLVLAGVAGGAYLIYWQMNQKPQAPNQANQDPDDAQQDDPNSPNPSDSNRSTSNIFEGLGTSDAPTPPTNPRTDLSDAPAIDSNPPETTPDPGPTFDRGLTKQLAGLENLLVTLSQGTRKTFAVDVRQQSSQAMQKALDTYPQALSALDQADPTLSPRIRAIVDAFAADEVDGPAIRDEIKAIRNAIDTLQAAP